MVMNQGGAMKKLFTLKTVSAHCDIPCGIYETDTIVHSAETCRRMIQKIESLGEIDSIEKQNTLIRSVMNKEKHAQKVKKEIYILWSDYFKPEHLEKFPDMHDKLWKTAKQASIVKQTVSMQETETLIEMVHDVAHLFADTKAK
jgi:nickel superoxide dismutase